MLVDRLVGMEDEWLHLGLPTDVRQTVQCEVLCYRCEVDCFFPLHVFVEVVDKVDNTSVDLAFESWYLLCCVLLLLFAGLDCTEDLLQGPSSLATHCGASRLVLTRCCRSWDRISCPCTSGLFEMVIEEL